MKEKIFINSKNYDSIIILVNLHPTFGNGKKQRLGLTTGLK